MKLDNFTYQDVFNHDVGIERYTIKGANAVYDANPSYQKYLTKREFRTVLHSYLDD